MRPRGPAIVATPPAARRLAPVAPPLATVPPPDLPPGPLMVQTPESRTPPPLNPVAAPPPVAYGANPAAAPPPSLLAVNPVAAPEPAPQVEPDIPNDPFEVEETDQFNPEVVFDPKFTARLAPAMRVEIYGPIRQTVRVPFNRRVKVPLTKGHYTLDLFTAEVNRPMFQQRLERPFANYRRYRLAIVEKNPFEMLHQPRQVRVGDIPVQDE
ncbi:MAG: hypothetical protein HY320_00205 [Armatimonadetes bacterium]|nr:hypothetical protein [Armatimonadota bacterium]